MDGASLRSARVGEWKYVDAPRPELYDLRRDAQERTNLVDAQQSVAGRLATELRGMADGLSGGEIVRAPSPDRETMERLRSLGYVGFVAPGASAAAGPDPKDMVSKLRDYRLLMTEASAALKRGDLAGAASQLRRAATINERAYDLHLALGDLNLQRKMVDAAIGEYEAAALLNPQSADPLVASAGALLDQGKLDQAAAKLERALSLEPLSPEVAVTRGRLAEREGRMADALNLYESAVNSNPSYARARALLANVAVRLGRFDTARTQFAALLGSGFEPARTHYGLGRVAEATGDRSTALKEYRLALQIDSTFSPAREALARLEKAR